MRIYEELFIVRPDATDEEVDPLVEQLKGVITKSGGSLDKTEKWGVRKLAYRVAKNEEGQYILLEFKAGADVVKEIERRLRVSDLVLKFLTVRIDEKLKRIEKRRKAREKRAARKPPAPPSPAVAASPLLPQEAPAPVPGAPAGNAGPAAPATAAPGAPAPETKGAE
ncbi:MAG TPA: 30S ribosomal protein S6 [Bryobacteraceae bacterium]|jgi:small subunit ribosomal protein S6|nr:30S ribosomal protein S6 [Bryobacteraceae bacterium]